MSKQLKLEEMVAIAKGSGDYALEVFVNRIENVVDDFAEEIAYKLKIMCGTSELTTDGCFCGFSPCEKGDAIPDALKPFDPEGDWEPTDAHTSGYMSGI